MPLFQYKALASTGKELKGIIDADSLPLAKERLRKQQILVTAILPLSQKANALRLPTQDLLAFTRELAQLLQAGLPLYDSLLTIEEKQKKSRFHALFVDLCDQVKGGSSLSKALSRYPKTFSEIYLSMVRSSEQSGSLAAAFDQLRQLLTKQQKWRKQLSSALAYPALLSVFCLLVTGCLFFFVIPSMEELFEDRALHPMTELVLSISRFLNHYWQIFTLGLSIFFLSGLLLLRKASIRIAIGKLALSTPYIRDLILSSTLVLFFRTMHMLLLGGIPFLEALGFARKTVSNPALQEVLLFAEKGLAEGKSISSLFAHSPLIPPLVTRMLHIAEESGGMDSLLYNLADIYEEDLDKNLSQVTTFLQPALLLFLGVVVGIVVLSILLPLTDVSSFSTS